LTSRSASRPERTPRPFSDTASPRTNPGIPVPEPRQAAEITLQEAYFNWLYLKVQDRHELITVCQLMHQVVFIAVIQRDENRIAVAAGLRNEFARFSGSLGPAELADLMEPECSVFEVLIGLADQADGMIPLTLAVWFRIFIENLGLDTYTDDHIDGHAYFSIEKIINRFNNRQYRPNGRGNIFPFKRSNPDQREIELWYQMGAYITQEGMY